MTPSTLDELKDAWLAAKKSEAQANASRLDIEAAILTHFTHRDEGTVSDMDTGVSVAYKLTRSVDTEALRAGWDSLSPETQAAFKWSASVDTKTLKAFQLANPEAYKAVARFVTTKPAKPSISIKE